MLHFYKQQLKIEKTCAGAHKTAQTKLLNALQRILPQADAQNASVASIGHNTTRG